MAVEYPSIADAVAASGFAARGAFDVPGADATTGDGAPADSTLPPVPDLLDGRPVRSVVIVGNVGGEVWPHFRAGETPGPDPLDRWTRSVLAPIAARFGAAFVHPSDEPFQPFQRWAQLADDVWPSPIGLLVHAEYGLWHAYRGAFLFAEEVIGAPAVGRTVQPCLDCADRPCLTTCPVDAFTVDGYDHVVCGAHVRSGEEPTCLTDGCAARRACPVGVEFRYGPDQMLFHMRAFVGH